VIVMSMSATPSDSQAPWLTAEPHSAEGTARPASGWIDRLQVLLERGPIGPWTAYGLAALLLALGLQLTHWLSGVLSFPGLSLQLAWTGAFTPICLACLHHVDRVAARSLARFQPALQSPPAEYDRALGRLTRLPRWTAELGLAGGAVFMWMLVRLDPTFLGLLTGRPWADAVLLGMGWINSAMILICLYSLVRQLSAVSQVHRSAGHVNLYDWQPMFAFSNLTYRSSLVTVLVTTCFVAVFPEVLDNPTSLLVVILGLLLTGAIFFLPLAGLNGKLQVEKLRLLSDVRRRIQATLEDLHQKIEADDLASMQRMKDQLGSLLLEEDYLGKLRTWPWPPGMFLRVLGVIGLPMLLFILQRAIDQWVGT
jgi:hypothetical protein